MLKVLAGLAFLLTAPSLAFAQAPRPGSDIPSAAEVKEITDGRIDLVKAALQLKPDQERLWPAVEEAIRARATGRYARLENLAKRRSEKREFNAVTVLRARADRLGQRSGELKKLADAWQPLYESLDASQKRRLRALAVAVVLRELRDAADENGDEDDDDED